MPNLFKNNPLGLPKPIVFNIKRLLIPLLLFIMQGVHGQVYIAKDTPYKKEIGNISINKIYQDNIGIIWLATNEGLVRFNGSSFEKFSFSDSLINVAVTSIYQDRHNKIWIGYKNGLVGFINASYQIELIDSSQLAPGVAITDIILDNQETLWIATYGEGLYYQSNNTMHQITSETGLVDDYIYDLGQDPYGKIWAGTDRGISICEFKNNSITSSQLDKSDGLKDNIVKVIESDRDGNFILGFYENGISKYDFNTKKISNENLVDWNQGIVNDVTMINDHEMIIGTERDGLWRYDVSSGKLAPINGNFSNNNKISSVMCDVEGNIWFSDNKANLLVIDPRFRFFQKPFESQEIKSFDIDKKGQIWYPGQNGLITKNPNIANLGTNVIKLSQLPNQEKIISTFIDDYGFLWLGTYESGVFRIDLGSKSIINIREEHGLVNNNVLSINGNGTDIWFATLGGVSKCSLHNPKSANSLSYSFENFDQQDGLGTNYIYQVFMDSKGQAWFATHGKGITVFGNGRLKNFENNKDLSTNVIYSIAEDVNGAIWLSTANGELYRYKNNEFSNLTSYIGNDRKPISGIINDLRGNLIIEFIDGIGLLDNDLNYFNLNSKIGEYSITGELNAIKHDGNGTIWIAADKGLIEFKQHEGQFQIKPKTVIESIEVYFENIPIDTDHTLEYNQNHISFSCHSTWYQEANDITYEYMLAGHDLDWQDSKDHLFTYPKLPPGNYSFQVKSSINNKSLSSNVVAFDFKIKAPFWLRPWFYLTAIIVIGTGLYYYIKTREKRLKHAEQLKKEVIEFQFETLKSQVNPHFLFNSFNTLIAIIEENQKIAVEYVSKLSDFFRNVLTFRNTQVITVEEELKLIGDYYFLQQKRYGENFSLKINVSEEIIDQYIPPMTLQLLTENALKHNVVSRKRPIIIEIFSEPTHLVVRNNLNIKAPDPNSTGMGLENIKNRYLLLSDKEIEIVKSDDYFTVKVPLLTKAK